MKVARMRYTFVLDIPIPDDPGYDAEFDIDDNHCLGTGRPGVAFEALMRWHDKNSTCWACGLVDQEWLGVHEVGRPYWVDEMGAWAPWEDGGLEDMHAVEPYGDPILVGCDCGHRAWLQRFTNLDNYLVCPRCLKKMREVSK